MSLCIFSWWTFFTAISCVELDLFYSKMKRQQAEKKNKKWGRPASVIPGTRRTALTVDSGVEDTKDTEWNFVQRLLN